MITQKYCSKCTAVLLGTTPINFVIGNPSFNVTNTISKCNLYNTRARFFTDVHITNYIDLLICIASIII